MCLVGGQLLTGLRAAGVALDAVNDVICTHLHSDHVGWLFDLHGDPVFPEATIWFGAADWCHFVEGPGEMSGHIEAGFRRWIGTSRVRPVEKGATVVRGVEVVPTPGHLCVVIESRGRRLLFLGDAITCPVQIEEPSWHSFGDVDPQLAAWTRDRLWRELAARTRSASGHISPSWSPEMLPIEAAGGGLRFAGNDVRHNDERHRRVNLLSIKARTWAE
jgi:glyoxylase-like metal-dependent hydrolase (beta-lactamase superfamily II)